LVSTRITLLYVIIIAILLSPYVVFTWGIGDKNQTIIIMAIYTFLALLMIYLSVRSNRKTPNGELSDN